MDSAAAAAREP